jgi:hypothetical protein
MSGPQPECSHDLMTTPFAGTVLTNARPGRRSRTGPAQSPGSTIIVDASNQPHGHPRPIVRRPEGAPLVSRPPKTRKCRTKGCTATAVTGAQVCDRCFAARDRRRQARRLGSRRSKPGALVGAKVKVTLNVEAEIPAGAPGSRRAHGHREQSDAKVHEPGVREGVARVNPPAGHSPSRALTLPGPHAIVGGPEPRPARGE